MQELINELKSSAGLSDEQAIKAIGIMKGFVMAKVPPMFSGVVESFFAGAPDGKDIDVTEIGSH